MSADNSLRHNDKDSLLSFSFHTMSEEWKEKALVFHRFLVTASDNPKSEQRNTVKRGGAILPGQISAGCKLLNTFNREMKALQNVNDLIFLKGGLKKSAFNRMKATGDCHSYKSAIDLADKLASKWNEELLEWQERNRRDNELEQELIDQIRYIQDTIQLLNSAGTSTSELVLEQAALQNELVNHRKEMHPGYYFVGDNVDMFTKVRQMTISNQHKDQHMYQVCAYLNRVSGNELDNSHPLQDANTACFLSSYQAKRNVTRSKQTLPS